VRDLAYDLLAPLAFVDLNASDLTTVDRQRLDLARQAPALHYRLAQANPALPYAPEADYWRRLRYQDPPKFWLQGLSDDQLRTRLRRFLIVSDLDGRSRLATREEFKAEFDRILRAGRERDQRALGVLINPLLGFTPTGRPVYWRVLAVQYQLYSHILNSEPAGPFDPATIALTRRFTQLS
jgi:hypothetical protein